MNRKKFYNYNPEELQFIPFDIETTGFKAGENDIVTTIVAHKNNTYHIWLNADGNTVKQTALKEDVLNNSSNIDDIMLYISSSETELLDSFGNFVSNTSKNGTIFTAFNGETYRGNTDFDMPFLRTRFFTNGISWPFTGYWYSDSYEVFSQKSRFNTTVTKEPSVDNLKSSELKQFIDDMNLDIHYSKMNKSEIVKQLNKLSDNIIRQLSEWAVKNNLDDSTKINSFKKKQLQKFIDDMDLDIIYKKLSKQELKEEIRNKEYDSLLPEWYDKTNKSDETMTVSTLDGIHEKIVEDKMNNEFWLKNAPIELELFDPFDPYENSSEAVTGFENEDYVNLILHCLSDVAKTVNLTRIMIEYVPQQDYRPKTL